MAGAVWRGAIWVDGEGFFGLGAVADRSGKEGRDILERLYWLVEAWFPF
jgi:hypothetical protein